MANPVREMNTVADGRKGDPQHNVEGKMSGGIQTLAPGETRLYRRFAMSPKSYKKSNFYRNPIFWKILKRSKKKHYFFGRAFWENKAIPDLLIIF